MGQRKWWTDLTPQERLIHYKRTAPCKCPINENEWPPELFEAFSHDPYFHTNHSGVHSAEKFFAGTCECNQCVNGSGLADDFKVRRRKNTEKVRDQIRQRLEAESNEKASKEPEERSDLFG